MALKIGDRVELVGVFYKPGSVNPYKGTVFECLGTIDRESRSGVYEVQWDNGRHKDGYKEGRDLRLYVDQRELECIGL